MQYLTASLAIAPLILYGEKNWNKRDMYFCLKRPVGEIKP